MAGQTRVFNGDLEAMKYTNRAHKHTCCGVFVAMILFVSASAQAQQWETRTDYDDIRDEYRDIAQVVNADGRYFGLYRTRGEPEVWVFLGIPQGGMDKMADGSFPAIRVDDRMPMLSEDAALLGLSDTYAFSAHTFFLKFPDASGVSQGTGFLYDLVAGNTVKARYWTREGEARRVEFPLTGSRAAIAKALQIESLPTAEEAARNQQILSSTADKMYLCGKKFSPHIEGAETPNQKALELCLDWANVCSEIVAQQPAEYEACFIKHWNIYVECEDYRAGPIDNIRGRVR